MILSGKKTLMVGDRIITDVGLNAIGRGCYSAIAHVISFYYILGEIEDEWQANIEREPYKWLAFDLLYATYFYKVNYGRFL